jgi:hypothetical protein
MIVRRDGKPLEPSQAGADVQFANGESYVMVQAERLYHLLKDGTETGAHTLELTIEKAGLKAYTFTFG